MPVHEILDKVLESRNFTVGGGAASALSGAMAAGLVSMVARLSAGKGLGFDDNDYESFSEELDAVGKKLAQGALDDEQAFLKIREAFALPKATDDEKAFRRGAIESAAVDAANVPLGNAREAARILKIAQKLEGRFNTAAASDMECGRMLARCALTGCALNIDANLPLIRNEETRKSFERASEGLKRSAADGAESRGDGKS